MMMKDSEDREDKDSERTFSEDDDYITKVTAVAKTNPV